MMKRVWKYGSVMVASALGVTMLACSDTNTAGTTFETENDIALTVLNKDGSPAANARVLVRRMDYVAGNTKRDLDDTYGVSGESPVGATDTTAGIFNAVTDANGQVSIKANIKPSSYVLEVRGDSDKVVTRLSITERDTLYPLQLKLATPGSISGMVYLPNGVRTASVGLQGIDYYVETDTLGNFTFESLPAGTFNVIGYVFTEQTYVLNGETRTDARLQSLGFVSTKVDTAKVSKATIGTAPVDTVVTYPDTLFENFENGISSWYTTVSEYAEVLTFESADAGLGREGKVAHFKYSNDSLYNWALIGHAFPKMQDFTDLDSIVLWARGTADNDTTQWISVSMDVLVDSTSEYKSGKAWTHVLVNNEWKRYVVTPADFLDSSDTNGGNLGWDAVKDHVTNFNLFGGGGSNEFWVDDIEFYGVEDFDRP